MSINPFIIRFAKRLYAARIAAGYETAADLARALEINDYTYRTYERGSHAPSILTLRDICIKTGKDANYYIVH
jgi:transcriptional regulator with XRE-family HTH domain